MDINGDGIPELVWVDGRKLRGYDSNHTERNIRGYNPIFRKSVSLKGYGSILSHNSSSGSNRGERSFGKNDGNGNMDPAVNII